MKMDTDFQTFMLAERASYQRKHAWIVLLGPFVTVPLTSVLLWSKFPNSSIVLWIAASIFIFLGSAYSHSYFRTQLPKLVNRPNEQQRVAEKWRRNAVIGSSLMGVSWGIVPWIFYDPSEAYLVMIFCVYAAYISSSVVVSSAYAPVFISFALGISIPFALRMFYQITPFSALIFTLICSLTIVLCFMSVNFHRLFEQAGRDRFDNQKLVTELESKNRKVLEAISSKNSFLAAASHDLRQPLNAISLFVDALRPHLKEQDGTAILDKIRLSLNGLNGMMHSILDISKLDANAIENNPVTISLRSFVQPLCDEHQAKTSTVKVINDIDPSYLTFVDATILHRVIGNLLDNAIKYTHEGQVVISAELKTAADTLDSSLLLKIQDTGVGVADNQLASIFDEFHQLDNSERSRAKGLGLGLSIVKRLCEFADFPLSITSVVGEGTLITMEVPSGSGDKLLLEAAKVVVSPNNIEQGSSDHSIVVAVIDDDSSTLDSMQLVLESLGHTVAVGSDEAEVIFALTNASVTPDILISDLRLHDNKSGVDVIHFLRKKYGQTLPALLITGDTAPDRISLARRSTFSILYKPVDITVLSEKIDELLHS